MRCSNELRDYENSLPPKIVIERKYDMVNPSGVYEIKIKNYKKKVSGGTLSDELVLKILKEYREFYGEDHFEFPQKV